MALLELQLGRQDAARARMDDGFARGEDGADARLMLATILAYSDGVSGAELSAAMRRAGDAWQRPGDGRPLRLPGRRVGRLRLGILGGGLWRHPSTWLTIKGIEALDRAEFEIHCFSPNRVSDEFTDRWKALATGWHSTSGKSDEAVAATVRRCAIDILIPVATDGPLVESERRRLDAVFAMSLTEHCCWPATDEMSIVF